MPDEYLPLDREAVFPNSRRGEYRVTSPEASGYNCIAYAAGKSDNWWWPIGSGAYWPVELSDETLDVFVLAYQTEGYAVCDTQSRELEAGFEKVAICVDSQGVPTHAARQLADGSWTSKLGEWDDTSSTRRLRRWRTVATSAWGMGESP